MPLAYYWEANDEGILSLKLVCGRIFAAKLLELRQEMEKERSRWFLYQDRHETSNWTQEINTNEPFKFEELDKKHRKTILLLAREWFRHRSKYKLVHNDNLYTIWSWKIEWERSALLSKELSYKKMISNPSKMSPHHYFIDLEEATPSHALTHSSSHART